MNAYAWVNEQKITTVSEGFFLAFASHHNSPAKSSPLNIIPTPIIFHQNYTYLF